MAVSVVIPTYQRLWSLPEAVASCKGTSCRTEIIVVDDGSTDGTWDWLSQQSGIIALRQRNLGKGWAVQLALSRASGEFVKFLDSDDAVVVGAIDRQYAEALRTGADIVASGMEIMDETGAPLRNTEFRPTDDFIAQQLGEGDDSHYSAFLFRRGFVADVPHRQEYGALDDRMFLLEAALQHPRVSRLQGQALRHRQHDRGRLQARRGFAQTASWYSLLKIYSTTLGQLIERGELTERRARAATRIIWPLAHWIAYVAPEDGAAVAEWVYGLVPDFVPPEPGVLGLLYRHFGFPSTEALLRVRRRFLRILRPVRRESPAKLHLPLPAPALPAQ